MRLFPRLKNSVFDLYASKFVVLFFACCYPCNFDVINSNHVQSFFIIGYSVFEIQCIYYRKLFLVLTVGMMASSVWVYVCGRKLWFLMCIGFNRSLQPGSGIVFGILI